MNNCKLYFMILMVYATVVQCQCKQFGYKLDGHLLRTIYRVSHDQCYGECLARSPCLSYTYHFSSQSCFLSRENETTSSVNLTKAVGYVYASKASWPETDVGCVPECSAGETCLEHNCNITECGQPPVGKNAHVMGNMLAIGSRILHVCTYYDVKRHQSTCLDTGKWSSIPDMDCPGELDGHLFRIYAKGDDHFRHDNGRGDKRISSRWQPNDQFVKFSFLEQSDGPYKIEVRNTFVYDVDGSTNILSTKVNLIPDSAKFFVTKEADGFWRIRAKRNGRLVRMDDDKFVSTRHNIDDEMSKFYLVKVD